MNSEEIDLDDDLNDETENVVVEVSLRVFILFIFVC
jgi:hypothetical protein